VSELRGLEILQKQRCRRFRRRRQGDRNRARHLALLPALHETREPGYHVQLERSDEQKQLRTAEQSGKFSQSISRLLGKQFRRPSVRGATEPSRPTPVGSSKPRARILRRVDGERETTRWAQTDPQHKSARKPVHPVGEA